MTLNGKTAIITGASRGIGEATAKVFAKQGASVVLAARSTADIERISNEIKQNGGKATAIECDIADFNAVQNLADNTLTEYGNIDVFIANAGIIEPISTLANSDPVEWGYSFDINLKGMYNCLRTTLPVMAKQKSGTFINVSSGAAHSPLEGWSHYCSAKAATAMLLRNANVEHMDDNIRFMALRPGTVRTAMQVAIKASGVNPVSEMEPSDHFPPEWPAKTLAWMCSSDADKHIGEEIYLGDPDIQKSVGLS